MSPTTADELAVDRSSLYPPGYYSEHGFPTAPGIVCPKYGGGFDFESLMMMNLKEVDSIITEYRTYEFGGVITVVFVRSGKAYLYEEYEMEDPDKFDAFFEHIKDTLMNLYSRLDEFTSLKNIVFSCRDYIKNTPYIDDYIKAVPKGVKLTLLVKNLVRDTILDSIKVVDCELDQVDILHNGDVVSMKKYMDDCYDEDSVDDSFDE